MNLIKRWRARRARIAAERDATEALLQKAFEGWNPADRPSDGRGTEAES
jgi:hypothetical protein